MLLETLQTSGLTEKQGKVYLASLELGQDTAFHIAKKCGLKRPTTYVVLDELVAKGLVVMTKTKNTTLYSPRNPKKILTQLKNKQNDFEVELPNLQKMFNKQFEHSTVKRLVGDKEVQQIYDHITDYALTTGKEVLAFGSLEHLEELYPDSFAYWMKAIRNRKTFVREILNATSENKKYYDAVKRNNNPNHVIRLLKKKVTPFVNDNLIFGNEVAYFSFEDEPQVILVKNDQLTNSLQSLFEMAWIGFTRK